MTIGRGFSRSNFLTWYDPEEYFTIPPNWLPMTYTEIVKLLFIVEPISALIRRKGYTGKIASFGRVEKKDLALIVKAKLYPNSNVNLETIVYGHTYGLCFVTEEGKLNECNSATRLNEYPLVF